MAETVKRMWLRDKDEVKISPTVELNQVLNDNGTRFKNDFDDLEDRVESIESNYCRFMRGTQAMLLTKPPYEGMFLAIGTTVYVSTGTTSPSNWLKVFEGGQQA